MGAEHGDVDQDQDLRNLVHLFEKELGYVRWHGLRVPFWLAGMVEVELIDLHSVIHGGKNILPELFAQMMQVSSTLIHMDNVGLPPSRL